MSETKPDIDTDFAQFQDVRDVGRRSTDDVQVAPCDEDGCARIVLVERRLNRHRKNIDELKKLIEANGKAVEKNSEDTSEILDIVRMGKSFFKVIGLIGDKLGVVIKFLVGVGMVIGSLAALVYWIKYGEPPPK